MSLSLNRSSSSSNREPSSSNRERSSSNREPSSSNREPSSQHIIKVEKLVRQSTLPKIDVKEIKQKEGYMYMFSKLKYLYEELDEILKEKKNEIEQQLNVFDKSIHELEKKKFLKKKEMNDLISENDKLLNKHDKDLTKEEKIKIEEFDEKYRVVNEEKNNIEYEIELLERSTERDNIISLVRCISESRFCIKQLLRISDSKKLFSSFSVEVIKELFQNVIIYINEYLEISKDIRTNKKLRKLISEIDEEKIRIKQLHAIRAKTLNTKKTFETSY